MGELKEPNYYELRGDDVTVTYRTLGTSSSFSYCTEELQLHFDGEKIRTQTTELGTEVSVTVEEVPDLRTVTFTLLVPLVNLGQEALGVELDTAAVETTNHTTIGGPSLIIGPIQTYRVVRLNGIASDMR
jgi:hypothetical protein